MSNHTIWAVSQLENFLPLPKDDLKQVVDYAASLNTPEEVAEHFQVSSRTLLLRAPLTTPRASSKTLLLQQPSSPN